MEDIPIAAELATIIPSIPAVPARQQNWDMQVHSGMQNLHSSPRRQLRYWTTWWDFRNAKCPSYSRRVYKFSIMLVPLRPHYHIPLLPVTKDRRRGPYVFLGFVVPRM